MREHHPMRYNRMTEILKVVACVKLSKVLIYPNLRKKDFFHVEEMIKCRAMVLMRVAPYRIN